MLRVTLPSTRVILDAPPALDETFRHERSPWASSWVAHPAQAADDPGVVAYRLRFSLAAPASIVVHVSADQRYALHVDGALAGRGPERGDRANWFFESYRVDLDAGDHSIVARTFWLSPNDPKAPAPHAQATVRPGFWLHAEGEHEAMLSTGLGAWGAKRLPGYSFTFASQNAFTAVGARTVIDGRENAWGWEKGEGDSWHPARIVGPAVPAWLKGEWPDAWLLRPAKLPAMERGVVHPGVARWIGADAPGDLPVHAVDDRVAERAAWEAMLRGLASVMIPPRTSRRVIIDLADYYCADPRLRTSGGRDAVVQVRWAEALYVPDGHVWEKGHRGEIEGKVFRGMGALYTLDGGQGRLYEPLWWEAGRYVEIFVTTADEALVIDDFTFEEVHYPHVFEHRFEASDPRLEHLVPIATRTLEMCSHETYYDCPYYEQLMYVGDTRLETLVTYVATRDDRLPRKAIKMFDASRTPGGLTQARCPSRVRQVIPPFSLWWIAMVHDYAMWRDDMAFVRERMPGVRAVLDAFRSHIDGQGLLGAMRGWNFVDWVPGWKGGVPPTAADAPTATLNFHLAWVMRQAAELETLCDEPELAARNRRIAAAIEHAAHEAFWDESRGLYAEDLQHEHFSQHAQCLALLGGSVPQAHLTSVTEGLFTRQELDPVTIYFAHYYFEACRVARRSDAFYARLEPWFALRELGLKTTVEMPEPSRSDCHGWGSHPLFHFYATLAGVRPASAGFRTVTIEPLLGPLTHVRGALVHPRGRIVFDLHQQDGQLSGSIELPGGVPGELRVNGEARALHGGSNRI